jgi:hypothetical protein
MLPEDFANLVERLTGTRPALPEGVDVVEAVDLAGAVKLAAGNADVARALRLVDLMLEGDDEIDWVAGYSALEVVEEDLKARGLNGRALGWWTKSEYKDFAATANSVEALGEYARHGKRFGLAEARMTRVQASWFIRRVVAHWLAYLPGSEQGSGDDDSANRASASHSRPRRSGFRDSRPRRTATAWRPSCAGSSATTWVPNGHLPGIERDRALRQEQVFGTARVAHPGEDVVSDRSARIPVWGSHVRQLGRRPSARLDMVDSLAATRSWLQRGRPRSGARERSVIALRIRSQGASGEVRP